MKYNPQIHHRRSIRLKGYDYSRAGAYFITICCQDKKCRFGKITARAPLAGAQSDPQSGTQMDAQSDTQWNSHQASWIPNSQKPLAQMELNEYGTIAFNEWVKLPERFANVELDVFQIMPNHMHGVILLNDIDRATTSGPDNSNMQHHALATMNMADPLNGQPQGLPLRNADIPNGQPQGLPLRNGEFPYGQPQGLPLRNAEFPYGQPQGLPLGDADIPNGQPQGLPLRNGEFPYGQPQGLPLRKTATLGDIVGAYKSLVTNACLAIYKTKNEMMGKLWQRNYYDVIIRNNRAYENISRYILNNPSKWNGDRFFI